MASADAFPLPIKAQPYRVTFPLLDMQGLPILVGTGLDAIYSIDAASPLYTASNPVEIGTTMGMYYLDLTGTETNGQTIAVVATCSNSGARGTPIVLYTNPVHIGELVTAAVATIVNAVHATPNWGNASATMTLKSLTVINSTGDAVSLQSTGSNGRALFATGNGSGAAMHWQGGTTGDGLRVSGGVTGGSGINAQATAGVGKAAIEAGASGSVRAIYAYADNNYAVEANSTQKHGVRLYGDSAGSAGLHAEAGLTGSYVELGHNVGSGIGAGMLVYGGLNGNLPALLLRPAGSGASVSWIATELGQAAPPATPWSLDQAAMMTWMLTRNQVIVDSTAGATVMKGHNDAGTVVFKKNITDDGVTYTEAEMLAGP
jgi:hypothetical protein